MATDEEIARSYRAARRIYWELTAIQFSASASASASAPKSGTSTANLSANTASQIANTEGVKEPNKRVCGDAGNRTTKLPLLEDSQEDYFSETSGDVFEASSTEAETAIVASFSDPDDEIPQGFNPYLNVVLEVFAMYESDELVGYGVSTSNFGETTDPKFLAAYVNAASSSDYQLFDISDPGSDIDDFANSRNTIYTSLNSTIEDVDSTFAGVAELGTGSVVISQIEVSGIFFLECRKTVNAAGDQGSNATATSSASFSFSGLDFYTYA